MSTPAFSQVARLEPHSVSSSRTGNKSEKREVRHYRELSLRLPSVTFTAIATDPGDPEVILAGSDGFIFKTDDGGDVWRPVLAFARGLSQNNMLLPLVNLKGDDLADAINDELMGLGIVGGVLPDSDELTEEIDSLPAGDGDPADVDEGALTSSPDAVQDLFGATSEAQALYPRQRSGVRSLVYVGEKSAVVYAATPRGLFRSLNAAESFELLPLPALSDDEVERSKGVNVRDVAIDGTNPRRIWVGTAAGLLFSNDEGQTFAPVEGSLKGIGILDLEWSRAANGQSVLLVGTEHGGFRSRDGGKTFGKMLLQGASAFEPVLTVAFEDRERIVYFGTPSGLFVSERGSPILELRQNLSGSLVSALSIDPRRLGAFLVGFEGRGPFLLADRGFALVEPQEALPVSWVSGIARLANDSDSLVLSTEKGVFIYEKGAGLLILSNRMQRLRERWEREPNLRETVEIAMRKAELPTSWYSELRSRIALAPLLPQFAFNYKIQVGNRTSSSLELDPFGDFVDGTEIDVLGVSQPTFLVDGQLLPPVNGIDHLAYMTATWNTDLLIFNVQETRLTRLMPRIGREREKIINRVVDAYHARRRLLTLVLSTDLTPEVLAYQLLKLAELTATLDAFTDGSFSELAEERGAPTEELQEQVLNELAANQAVYPLQKRQVRIARTPR